MQGRAWLGLIMCTAAAAACESAPVGVVTLEMPAAVRQCLSIIPAEPAAAFHGRVCAEILPEGCVLELPLSARAEDEFRGWESHCPARSSTITARRDDGVLVRFSVHDDVSGRDSAPCADAARLSARCAERGGCITVRYRTIDEDGGRLVDPEVVQLLTHSASTSTQAFQRGCFEVSCRALEVATRVVRSECSFCANGIRERHEDCDDGNRRAGDGCAADCREEDDWTCTEDPDTRLSSCQSCGNGQVEGTETCDNGRRRGCTACQPDANWLCDGSPVDTACWSCGDGVVDAPEVCDRGRGCASNCLGPANEGWTCRGTAACEPRCGDGIVVGVELTPPAEQCDPGAGGDWTGCSRTSCLALPGYECPGGRACRLLCGNGRVDDGEACDVGAASVAGCQACAIVEGYSCRAAPGAPSTCTPNCGDHRLVAGEECDDGRPAAGGDGCSATCTVELGFTCRAEGGISVCQASCGDGRLRASEACDDGPVHAGDGCSATCTEEYGYDCTNPAGADAPSVCVTECGDGEKADVEDCDDGNLRGGDGCDRGCHVEANWDCASGTCVCPRGPGEVGLMGQGTSSQPYRLPARAGAVTLTGLLQQGTSDYFEVPYAGQAARVRLTPPSSADYDLFLELRSSSGVLWSSPSSTEPAGVVDVASLPALHLVGASILIRVRYASGSSCDTYTLSIETR